MAGIYQGDSRDAISLPAATRAFRTDITLLKHQVDYQLADTTRYTLLPFYALGGNYGGWPTHLRSEQMFTGSP